MTLQEWFFYLIFLIPFCRDDLFHLVNKENFLSLKVSNITNFLLQGWYVCKDDFFTWSIRRIQRMTEKHHHWTILQTCNFWIEIIREVITVQDNNPKITIPWHFWKGLSQIPERYFFPYPLNNRAINIAHMLFPVNICDEEKEMALSESVIVIVSATIELI